MSQEAYELAALTMRYVFTALMLLIVWRACRGALIDSRRAAKLRQLSPMTGVCGELVALEADERLRRGMRFPVIREGAIGSARRSDVRIRHSSVRRRHAFFQLADDGLHVRSHAGARLRDGGGRLVRELVLTDGDELTVGRVRLLLVLSVPDAPRRAYTHRDEERRAVRRSDDGFDFPGDDDFPDDARRSDDGFFPDDLRKPARRTVDDDFSFPGDADFVDSARRADDLSGDGRRVSRKPARRSVDDDFSFSGDADFVDSARRTTGATFPDDLHKPARRAGDGRRVARKPVDGRRPADDFDADPDDLFDVDGDSF